MKTAYLDCFSGISGDMFLGALLDAGLPLDDLQKNLGTLPLGGYKLVANLEERNHISGTRFIVEIDSQKQVHRNLKEIRKIITQGKLSNTVKSKSIEIFKDLAEVEGKIHNRPIEEVHFHEVGAVDSIIDIVGTVYGLEYLEISRVFSSPLPLGSGFVETAHGRIPVPAPATIALLKGVPVYDSGLKHEMVTPTGAALAKGLVHSFGEMPPMMLQEIGYGAGKAELSDRPNLLRFLVGETQSNLRIETVLVLETNLDDISPEWLGYLMDCLFEAGALDVVFFPVQMKKNRPGVQVQVIGHPEHFDDLMSILFKETSTLGIRYRYSSRKILERDFTELESPWGNIKAKKISDGDDNFQFIPEYEACREMAAKNGIPLKDIYYWIMGLNKSWVDKQS